MSFSVESGTEPGASPVLLLPGHSFLKRKRLFLALSGADLAPNGSALWELLVGSAGLRVARGAAPQLAALLTGTA